MTFKINSKFMTINGKRVGVYINVGPWAPGVRADMIKLTPRKGYRFPTEVDAVFDIDNDSDYMTDYYVPDQIRLYSDHPLYKQIKAAA